MAITKLTKIPSMVLSIIITSTLIAISIPKVASLNSLTLLLKRNGLPPGIFPRNVDSFTVDLNGRLTITLENPCYAEYENMVHFNKVVTANLSYGELLGLKGLEQKELFLWLPVKSIKVNDPESGVIMIDIGVACQEIAISVLEEPPLCTEVRSGYKEVVQK